MIWKPVVLALGLALSVGASVDVSAQPKKSLYERLGGQKAITAVVDDLVANIAKDKRINRLYDGSNIPRLKRLLVEQICASSGGPCSYTGRDMKSAHKGMGIGDNDFDAFVDNLNRSLVKFKVPESEQRDLLAILGPMRKDIVEHKR
jgi:hemoglobin